MEEVGEKISDKLISFDYFLALSDNPTFREYEVVDALLRARLDEKKMRELKRKLFK